jgi:hypothetical protein
MREAIGRAEVASAEAKQSLERQGDYRSVQEQPRAPRRLVILYSFVGAVPTIIGSYGISRNRSFLTKLKPRNSNGC